MSQKISKEELKSPDAVLGILNPLVLWAEENISLIFKAIGVLIFGALSWNGYVYMQNRSEKAAQEKYFLLEKSYVDQKEKYDEAAHPKKPKDLPKDLKNTKDSKDVKGAKNNETKIEDEKEKSENLRQATGNLIQDYGKLPEDLKAFILENPKSLAAKMAALNLVELLNKYNKSDEALVFLNQIEKNLNPNELLSALVLNQMATLLANKKECQQAIDRWSLILKNQKISYLYNEVKLRMGLCYEALGEQQKALSLYTEVSQKAHQSADKVMGSGKDMGPGQDAEKFLRLLKLKMKPLGS